jgi:hypothetical protein
MPQLGKVNTNLGLKKIVEGAYLVPLGSANAVLLDGGPELALADAGFRRPGRRFLYVTFPLLRETTLIVLAITLINALKAYDIIYAMTNGGPATICPPPGESGGAAVHVVL